MNTQNIETQPKTKTKKRRKDTQITFWADENDVKLLDALAEATGMNKSQVIRFAIKLLEGNYCASLARKSEAFKSGSSPSPFVDEIPLELSMAIEREITKV